MSGQLHIPAALPSMFTEQESGWAPALVLTFRIRDDNNDEMTAACFKSPSRRCPGDKKSGRHLSKAAHERLDVLTDVEDASLPGCYTVLLSK